jgi:hypothetical protein
VTALGHALVGVTRDPVGLVELGHARELDHRVGMVLDAQRGHRVPGLAGCRHDQDRRRLATAQVAAGGFGNAERSQQPRAEAAGRPSVGLEHRGPHLGVGHDVGLAGDPVGLDIAGEGHAGRPRVGRDPAARVDDRHLARRGERVGGEQSRQGLRGGNALSEQIQRARPVGDLDVGLGGHRPDAGPGPRNDGPDREPM